MMDNHYKNSMMVLNQPLKQLWTCMHQRECSKTVRSNHPWFDHDAERLKLQQRLAEKNWLKSGNNADKTHHMDMHKCYLKHLYQLKKSYIHSQKETSNNKSQILFKILQQPMKGQQNNPLPDSSSQEEFTDIFADFFINKIMKIRSQFQHSDIYTPSSRNCGTLTHCRPIIKRKP